MFFHEVGHLIDNWMGGYSAYRSVTFKNGVLGKTLKEEADSHIELDRAISGLKTDAEIYRDLSDKLQSIDLLEQHEISDIWHGVSGGKIHGFYGHDKEYWKKDNGNNIAKEAFAHMFCATIQNPAALEHILKYFPKSYGVFTEIVNEHLKGRVP